MGADNEIIGGRLYSGGDYQDRLRKYAQDEDQFKFFALYKLYELSILRVISEKFGRVERSQITDFEVKYPEMEELEYQFTPAANSTDDIPNRRSLVPLANDLASSLHENMILMINGLYADATSANTSPNMSGTCPLPETCRVISVGNTDSGGLGFTNITLKRLHPTDAPAALPLPITTTMSLILVNNVAREDSLPYPPSTKNSDFEYNYIQTTRESYGISSHVKSGIKTFLDKDQLDINLEMCSGRVMREIETAILMGRRSKKRELGKMLYETGGILEFVPPANYINVNAIMTTTVFKNIIKRIADEVGSTISEMWMFCGSTFLTKLDLAFEGRVIYSPSDAESIKYAIKVKEFHDHAGNMRFFIAPAPILNMLGMANEAIVLNLSDKYRPFQIAEKEPMSDRPEDKESLSPDGQYSTWRELYQMWGITRRLARTHYRLYNVL